MSAGKKFIGLDVHQDTIAIAVADDGMDREVRYFGTIASRPEALHELAGFIWDIARHTPPVLIEARR